MNVQVVRKSESGLSLEGVEVCRQYISTPKITFGTSTLQPGQKGDIDLGHPNSHEVFFVVKGHVLLICEKEGKLYELFEQDAILMPEGVTHTLMNIGDSEAVISWSKAPTD